ncbi:heme peroxidase family protein [Erythrobacter sp. F6033]|uniref:peroxidase family protein n=1 Tax=Erythrobacter sp. F6033 TaxID=2926401 RepID=UPI001FF4FB55|nr:heme peroxidase family protein [Erythrobacter sp. F6033]MCK0128863.1 heme peroxidase family protein [Erythrobacter sp. F6033]
MSNSEHHGMKPLEGLSPYCRMSNYGQEQRDDRFGRLFGDLAPNYTNPAILIEAGKAGGNMEDPNDKGRTDNVPVGMIFFGQFVDHDITLDASTTFDSVIDNPGEVANVRTPTLDLDCIYGLGPEAQPYLFSQDGAFAGVKLLTGADNPGQAGIPASDLLRSPNGRAIIGDPRNDENRIISQIQLAIIRFHNRVAQTLHDEEGLEGHDLYEEARRTTTWHYQWAVVNDFLTDICGKPVVERILGCGREFYCSDVPFIPIEFSVAAYRFGHSMIPMKVQVQKGGNRFELFGTKLGRGFDALSDADAVVDWHELLFTPENRIVERAQKMDTLLAGDLLDLPFVNGSAAEKSLATRNMLRGNTFLLPAGEKVAEAMGCEQKDIDKVIKKANDINSDFGDEGIPLWLYILAEAEVIGRAEPNGSTNEGEGLGPVGATIVAEVIIGLLELDDHAYLGANRNWSPREEWNTLGKLVTVAQP